MVNGQNVCAGDMIFNDTFDILDKNRWQNEIKFAEAPVLYNKIDCVLLRIFLLGL